jgi:hypothetical protein
VKRTKELGHFTSSINRFKRGTKRLRRIIATFIVVTMAMTNPLLHRQIYEYFRCLVVNGKEELIEDRKGFKVLKALEVEFPDLLVRESTIVSTAIMAPYVETGSPLNYHNRLLSNSKKILVARGECHESEFHQSTPPLQSDQAHQRKRKQRERIIHVAERPSVVVSSPVTMEDEDEDEDEDDDASATSTTAAETAGYPSEEMPQHAEAAQSEEEASEPAKRPRVDPALVQAVLRELEMPCEVSPLSHKTDEGTNNGGQGVVNDEGEPEDNLEPIDDPHWDATYQLLVEFNNRYGHVHVPQYWTENEYLGNWVHQQRENYRLGIEGKTTALTKERIDRLQSLSFSWTPKSEVWNQRFGELLEYRQRVGHTNVPQQWSENKQVSKKNGNWY